jgi:hypothetical protein
MTDLEVIAAGLGVLGAGLEISAGVLGILGAVVTGALAP